jgi:DNA-binding XRE family transcriptional regulator
LKITTTAEFLDAVKRRLKLRSDAALANTFGVTKMAISKLRNGQMLPSPKIAAKIAEILELEVEHVRTCVERERANLAVQRAKAKLEKLENVAKKLAAGVGALLVAGLVGALLPSSPAEGAPAASTGADHATGHYVKSRYLRLARSAYKALSALRRYLSTPRASLRAVFPAPAWGAR